MKQPVRVFPTHTALDDSVNSAIVKAILRSDKKACEVIKSSAVDNPSLVPSSCMFHGTSDVYSNADNKFVFGLHVCGSCKLDNCVTHLV